MTTTRHPSPPPPPPPPPAPAPAGAGAIRPPEMQDWLNARVYHPLSRRLATALVPSGISPNAVSVCGGLLVVLAAFAYTRLPWPLSVAAGFALHLLWHVVDGADGALARMTGRTSATGELIDGLCDYAGHIVLYVALAVMLVPSIGAGAAWSLAVAAGASHIVQANHAESQKRVYLWWAYGVPWLRQAQVRGDGVFGPGGRAGRAVGWPARAYLRLALAMNAGAGAVDRAFAGVGQDAASLERMRATVRARGRTMLRYAKLTGPNPRAFLLAAAMAAGSAAWFFVAEITVLNLLLVAAMVRQRRDNRDLAARLAALATAPAGTRDGAPR